MLLLGFNLALRCTSSAVSFAEIRAPASELVLLVSWCMMIQRSRCLRDLLNVLRAQGPRAHTRYDRVLGFTVWPGWTRALSALRERTCVRMPMEPTAIADPSIKHTTNTARWGRRRIFFKARANILVQ